ncbi:hypothetical protein H6775_00665 [Candidatus Nomurabacteria bacterium]|nr:hypothetical protein [Candidatus Nomurabacteria bacterium]
MSLIEIINTIVVIVGVPTLIGFFIKTGKKLQILEDLEDVRKNFSVVKSRVDDLWADRTAPAKSPRQLNERGLAILEESKIDQILNKKIDVIEKDVKDKNPQTAYDAEREITESILALETLCPDITERLKDGAFKSGEDIETVLFVGAISVRDQLLKNLGFNSKEL